jgi:putative flippase GtrA
MFDEFLSNIHANISQFVRFIFIGLINTIFGYSVFYFLLKLSSNLFFSTLVAYLLGILFNSRTIGLYVFNHKDNNLIIKFFYFSALIFLLNFSCILLLNKFFKLEYYFGAAIMVIPIALLSFFLNRAYVFNHRKT